MLAHTVTRFRRGARSGFAFAAVLCCALLVAGCGGGGSGGDAPVVVAPPPPTTPPAGQDSPLVDAAVYSTNPVPRSRMRSKRPRSRITRPPSRADAVQYTATAGHLTTRSRCDRAPHASFFYVAYTLDGPDPVTRPVTFFYNGGPGSATVWLHLGSFGPSASPPARQHPSHRRRFRWWTTRRRCST